MAVTATEEGQQDTAAVFPEESITNPQSESQLGFQGLLVVPNIMKSHMCLGSHSNGQNFTQGKIGNQDGYALSILDVDIEKGKIEPPKSNDEAVGSFRSEDTFTRAVQRDINFQIGGKLMQLLMNPSLDLPKFTSKEILLSEPYLNITITFIKLPVSAPSPSLLHEDLSVQEQPEITNKSAGERVYDTPTNRSRKYKRSASFNSRRVVILFSFLSIMGTMILIYLTLKS